MNSLWDMCNQSAPNKPVVFTNWNLLHFDLNNRFLYLPLAGLKAMVVGWSRDDSKDDGGGIK